MPARKADYSLAQAIALLIHNEAKFVSHLDETNQRFARIERDLDEIKATLLRHEEILLRHEQSLQNLTEAIREKIGFKNR